MIKIRRWGAAVLLLAALAVWFGMAPDDTDPAAARSDIETTDDANNELAEGAPQQAVVNGWTQHDYSALISEQLETAAASSARSTAMLGLCVIGICLLAATSSAERPVGPGPAGPRDAPALSPGPT